MEGIGRQGQRETEREPERERGGGGGGGGIGRQGQRGRRRWGGGGGEMNDTGKIYNTHQNTIRNLKNSAFLLEVSFFYTRRSL